MQIVIIAHNIRSIHNIGSIFRTCDGFGVQKLILSGYSPYPHTDNDSRLPHISQKITAHIEKTALGASTMVPFAHVEDPQEMVKQLRDDGYRIVGLEQSDRSVLLGNYQPPEKLCLILGEEVAGISADILQLCDDIIEIPMQGQKESFNVSVATGIALYGLSEKRHTPAHTTRQYASEAHQSPAP